MPLKIGYNLGDKHFGGVICHGYLGCFPTSNKLYCDCMVSTKKILGEAMCVQD